jgi:hypothetical protein
VTLPYTLPAEYFDGVSARAQRVQLRIDAEALHVDGDGVALRLPLADVRWPERTRHGARVAHLRAPSTGVWSMSFVFTPAPNSAKVSMRKPGLGRTPLRCPVG